MKYKNIREEELKNKVAFDWFQDFDTTKIIGNIDFTVSPALSEMFEDTAKSLLWAEAKTGNYDTVTMFVQLILTIGKARTFDKMPPPVWLGAFDFTKMAFVPYIDIQDIFYLNDFNWNVTPSNHNTKEFQLIKQRIEQTLQKKTYAFDYEKDEKQLRFFISKNIAKATQNIKVKIHKNNFFSIYLRWLEIVKPIIEVNWDELKKNNILDSDFFLADLFVDDRDTQNIEDDTSIRDNLFVIFDKQGYKIAKENLHQIFDATITIRHKNTYSAFWKQYKRPPIKEFQEYIIERRDLLVPQDIRERKGAFFTPRIWVDLSQKYISEVFGENWQEEYFVWDCAAGTGNLLAGLTNKFNVFASTIDQADVNVMHERIEHGANLLKSHVFQFDFLNDDLYGDKVPEELKKILKDPEKRKKLIIYINPPYAEAGNAKSKVGTGEHKGGTATNNKTYEKYKPIIKKGSNELFAQFLARIYNEIPTSKIANFSKLKNLQSSNFKDFRNFYRAKLEKIFMVPADTFDNVTGHFPIGFFIWDSEKEEKFEYAQADVYDKESHFLKKKNIYSYDDVERINKWIFSEILDDENRIGHLSSRGSNDFQGQSSVNINRYIVKLSDRSNRRYRSTLNIDKQNLIKVIIYFSARHCIAADWLNDRDQFLYPNDGWKTDKEFQSDCLAFTIFHSQNRISSQEGINHWIPFTEQEVDAKERFESHFMTDFLKGKLGNKKGENQLFTSSSDEQPTCLIPEAPISFSAEAQAVFDAGKELWKYYHTQTDANPNASLYDIRAHFQGRNDKGKMNAKSDDAAYTGLMNNLKENLKNLAEKITPKVYAYGFLRE